MRHVFSAKALLIPAIIVLLILHLAAILNTINIDRLRTEGAEVSQFTIGFSRASKSLFDVCDKFTDQASLYVETGDPSHLEAYADALAALPERDAEMRLLAAQSGAEGATAEVAQALEALQQRLKVEQTALRLFAESRGVNAEDYDAIRDAELTEAQSRLNADGKRRAADEILHSAEFEQLKGETGGIIGGLTRRIATVREELAAKYTTKVEHSLTAQWMLMVVIILILALVFLLLSRYLIRPLDRSAARIRNGETLPTEIGFSEFRKVALSYNELLEHRKMMEDYLRRQSQIDALTKLPNRTAFQELLAGLVLRNRNENVTIFSMDVNGLKETNDTKGHVYGDDLLCRAAACVSEVFGGDEDRTCYRMGGDEFAAIWLNVPDTEIEPALEKFKERQVKHGVSIAVGYARTNTPSKTTMDAIFAAADKSMYEEKLRYHEMLGTLSEEENA
ncbi:MAG: GGDEF domain-containing protein [Oscillibacter sp.]|nr:GGDEF domain-containing protein [Oscillibacter sp.]